MLLEESAYLLDTKIGRCRFECKDACATIVINLYHSKFAHTVGDLHSHLTFNAQCG